MYDAAAQLTYQVCYSDPEASAAAIPVDADFTGAAPLEEGRIALEASAPNLVREYTVTLLGQREGVFRINLGTLVAPDFVYCTGRGNVAGGGSLCRINPCDYTTSHFITFASDNACYHTCFRPNAAAA